ENPSQADTPGWTATASCGDYSPVWADQQPSGGYAIMDLYTDNQPPPSIAATANLKGAGTNLNSSNPTLEWDFTPAVTPWQGYSENTDTPSGSSGDTNDEYASGTQYYAFNTWIDQNNTYETSPPSGNPSADDTAGEFGSGQSGFFASCLDGSACSYASSQVAVGYTSHFCMNAVDWLGNAQASSCTYQYISSGNVTLTPATQTLPDTATATLDVNSNSAPGGESLLLEDTSTGVQSVVTTSASSYCGAITLTSALSTSGAITALPVTAVNILVDGGDTILLTSGSHTQTFTVSGGAGSSLAAGATSIPVDSQTPNYAYPIGSAVTDNTPHISLASGEELILTNASNLACSVGAAAVGDGTYNFSAWLSDSGLNSYSFSAPASASVTWIPWQVTLSANGQANQVDLSSGTTAQLLANTATNLALQTAPGQELEIFAATDTSGVYTPSGADLLASACTSGTICPSSGYLDETQPASNTSDCVSATYLDSC
ncbi:MAG: hypothetical protein ACREF7_01850, partial [Candidatus Saccharimonadales bacterium]